MKRDKREKNQTVQTERYFPDKKTGLTLEQAKSRQEQGLRNVNTSVRSKSYLKIVVGNITNFCNIVTLSLIILLIAIGAWDYAVSSFILFINIGIGIFQEVKAKRVVERLTLVTSNFYDVLRDGEYVTTGSGDILLDDLFILRAGGQIPVDGVVCDGHLEVDESILTGESCSVKKTVNATVLAGSYVKAGQALVRADKIGAECYINGAAEILKDVSKPQSKIFNALDKIIKLISIGLIPLAILLFISNFYNGPLNRALIMASSSVLGMIPVGMFLLTSMAFAASVIKLSKKQTLLKDLYAVEMLAATDVLLFDKTGTITDGNLEVVDIKVFSDMTDGKDALTDFSAENILTTLIISGGGNNATARAIKSRFKNGRILPHGKVIPFDSDKKFSAAKIENGYTYILGAPDFLTDRADVTAFAYENSKKCRRTVLLGRVVDESESFSGKNVIPIMALSIEDELRGEIAETFAWFEDNGVDIKVISGDDPHTVAEIVKKAGLKGAEKGVNCNGMDDCALEKSLNDNVVFGRTSPEQKAHIVNTLKKQGRVVCMVGDGVNDIQALKQADCSISFATASDAARNISRIVLMDSEFKNIPAIVGEGRRAIGNIQKVSSLFIMKNLFVMFMTLLFAILTFVDHGIVYPFDSKKMIMMEVFVLGIPAYVIALERVKGKVTSSVYESVLKYGVPSALSLIVGVSAVLITSAVRGDDAQYASSIAAITFAMTSFICLFLSASPLGKLSFVSVAAMIILSVVAVYVDKTFLQGTFLNIDFPKTADFALIVLCSCLTAASNLLFRKLFVTLTIKNKNGKKKPGGY
ncbi:MAG: HAD-IC family P-type ATPase [Clostridiales bacterium]|jgi:cation-transporting ATPase E|nr:HAD-IC family P-type ATPase [Clostridiales bacterium]